ncbi:MAG: response regulator [Candidatus Thiodiazotropha sp.]|jgi:DNA-binding response OmpR family regulator/EAL domain-containing protein (putative c-di-GMP-specific phosphodiesterase class I)
MSSNKNLLNDKVLGQLPALLNNIKGNWPVLPSGIWNSSGIQAVLRLLHELAGKSEAAGLVNILELTRSIDKVISDVHEENAQPDAEEVEKLGHLLNELTRVIEAAEGPTSPTHTDSNGHSDVIYLHPSDLNETQIPIAIEKNGWRVSCLTEFDALLESVGRLHPKVILIDTAYLPQIEHLTELLSELRQQKIKPPELIFLSNHCDIEIRLEVLRCGATHCFSEPVNINDLMLSIKEIISPQLKLHHRVLIVEDDEAHAKFSSALLKKVGFETIVCTEPLTVMEAVQSFQPDLILMDLYMPGANGIELTQMIRARKELFIIPIVFISGEDDVEKKVLALYSGADDFLTKPVRPQHLVATVESRINRSKEMLNISGMGLLDTVTGMKNRRWFLQELDMHGIREFQSGTVCGVFSMVLNDHESELDGAYTQEDNALLMRVVDVIGVVTSKRDAFARTGKRSVALLVKRSNVQAIDQLGKELYQQLSDELSHNEGVSNRWGVGLVMIDSRQAGAYKYLKRAEATALQAMERESKDYLSRLEEPPAEEEVVPESFDFQSEQIQSALQSDFVQFFEQSFLPSQKGDSMLIELHPMFTDLAGVSQESGDIYQNAEKYDASDILNQLLCRHAVHRLGEAVMKGSTEKVIIRLSGLAIHDEQLVSFIQSELRKLHVVGTGLIIEFDLPSLALDLKRARQLLNELSGMGISVLLGYFTCNDTALRVLAYLKAHAVRPHPSLMQQDAGTINKVASQIHTLHATIILPRMEKAEEISPYWSAAADYVQAD